MPMQLQGSCHCGLVTYTLKSNTPVPYQLCQCSICRKTGGYMGSVNIMGLTDTLEISSGKESIKEYKAVKSHNSDGSIKKRYNSIRSFCMECSSMLWNYDDQWPEWIYPFASSINTTLPSIPHGASLLSIKRNSCPDYVPVPKGAEVFEEYAEGEGIEAWHKKHGAWVD